MAALATISDMAAYVQRTIPDNDAAANFYLRLASNAVIGYLNFDPTPVAADQQILNPLAIRVGVELPGWPVTAVSTVEVLSDRDRTTWTDVTALAVVDLDNGIIWPLPTAQVEWPTLPGSWRVTYSHGYTSMPDAIVAAVAAIAGENYSTEAGVKSESQGGWSTTYTDRSGQLITGSPVEVSLRPLRRVSVA